MIKLKRKRFPLGPVYFSLGKYVKFSVKDTVIDSTKWVVPTHFIAIESDLWRLLERNKK